MEQVEHDDVEGVRVCLRFDSEAVYRKTKEGWTPLHQAAKRKNGAIVKVLLQYGAEPDARDLYGRSALHYAAYEDSVDCAASLLEGAASAHAFDAHRRTPVHVACENPDGRGGVIDLLQKHHAALDTRDKYGMTPLHIAAKNGSVGNARRLLSFGADKTLKVDSPEIREKAKQSIADPGRRRNSLAATVDTTSRKTPYELAVENGHKGEILTLLHFPAQAKSVFSRDIAFEF